MGRNKIMDHRCNSFKAGVWLFRLLIITLLVLPIQSFGHAKLLDSSPQSGSQLEVPPEKIELVFNQKLEAVLEDAIKLTDAQGNSIELSKGQIGEDQQRIIVPLPQLTGGEYRVQYDVLSLDGHDVKGAYNFTLLTQGQTTVTEEEPIVENDKNKEPDVPVEENHDHHPSPNNELIPQLGLETQMFGEWAKGWHTEYLITILHILVYILLIGMVLWSTLLKGRTEEEWNRHRSWTMQLQRLHFLALIGVVVLFIQRTVGMDDWSKVKDLLLETTTGISWSVLIVLSVLGFLLLQRSRLFDAFWLIAIIGAKTQIGHAAAADERLVASIMTGIHVLAASLWAAGLLLLILLWRKYRFDAERFLPTFSGASIVALILLSMSGLVSSAIYLPDLSYVLETRWGLLLLIKLVLIVFIIAIGATIRRRFTSSGVLRLGALIKFDFLIMAVIAALAALLTTSEPVPTNEPLHWHEMGEEIHMTAEVSPHVAGSNSYKVTVWTEEGADKPEKVEMRVYPGKTGGEPVEIPLEPSEGTSEYGFPGFTEYIYYTEGRELNHIGWWRIEVTVTDAEGKQWPYVYTTHIY
jgi:copper transport protein